MKVFFFLLFVIVTPTVTFAQNDDDKITYEAKSVYIVLKDDKGAIVTAKPVGKSVSVYYNKFFKSYQVYYRNEQGELAFSKFSYINTDRFGHLRVKDPYGAMFYVKDEIITLNVLTFVGEEKAGDYFMEFTIREFNPTVNYKESIYEGNYKFKATFDNVLFEPTLKVAPNINSRDVYKCPKNSTVYVIDNTSDDLFFKVYVDGYTGYISKNCLKRQW